VKTIERVLLAAEDTRVRSQITLAEAAEAAGIEGVWVTGPATGHGDSYATATAAAIASATTDLRVGVVLGLAMAGDVLRLAEDLAVLDHCSSGRAELCLGTGSASQVIDPVRAELLLTNLRTCWAGDRQIAVTPGPLQPAIPAVAHGGPVAGTGTVVELDDCAGTDRPMLGAGRVVLYVRPERTRAVVAAADDPATLADAVRRLRDAVGATGARDLLFVVPRGDGEHSVEVLGAVIAPVLRANEDEVADLVLDTLKFRRAAVTFPR
jgi:hypothetical protein